MFKPNKTFFHSFKLYNKVKSG